MQQLSKAEKIKQCVSQLDEITTVAFRGQVEQLVKGVANSIFNIVLHGVDELCKKAKKLESVIAIEFTLNELLMYCKNCNQLSKQTNNTIHDFEILPAVLKARLLSSLNSKYHVRLLVTEMAKRLEQDDNWIIYWAPDEIETCSGTSDVPDPTKKGIVFKLFDDKDDIANAVRYCLKGLTSGISTGIVDNEKADAEEPISIQAWCSTHSIRRYTSSAIGKTLWRDLRKLPDFGSEAQKAAKEGGYARFYKITQQDKNEVFLPMHSKDSGRAWIFAKKTAPDSPLVVVSCFQTAIPKIPIDLSKNENVVEVDLTSNSTNLTVIYNKRDSLESMIKTKGKHLFKIGLRFLNDFKNKLKRLYTTIF